jgi:hypothetical protein
MLAGPLAVPGTQSVGTGEWLWQLTHGHASFSRQRGACEGSAAALYARAFSARVAIACGGWAGLACACACVRACGWRRCSAGVALAKVRPHARSRGCMQAQPASKRHKLVGVCVCTHMRGHRRRSHARLVAERPRWGSLGCPSMRAVLRG